MKAPRHVIILGMGLMGCDIVMVAHMFTEAIHQRGFAGPNRATNANAKRAMLRCAHDLNNLVYCVS